MALTPEERQRIYEEEKARIEAQKILKANQKKRKDKIGLAVLAAVCLVGLVIYFSPSGIPEDVEKGYDAAGHKPSGYVSMPPPERPEANVSIKKFQWEKGGFDTVFIATFTLENHNAYAVKDIGIKCEVAGNSGTKIDSVSQTIYDRIPAKTVKTFRAVSMGFIRSQASQADCEIKSAAKF